MKITISSLIFFLSALWSHGQSSSTTREAFMEAQDAYLASMDLDFYQNKEYQIITRNADKQEMKIQLSSMPARLKTKQIKKVRQEKNKEMKKLLNSRQYHLYLVRQKEIEKTLSKDW